MKTKTSNKKNAHRIHGNAGVLKKTMYWVLSLCLVTGSLASFVASAAEDYPLLEVPRYTYAEDGFPAYEHYFVVTMLKVDGYVKDDVGVKFIADNRIFEGYLETIGPYWGFYVASGYIYDHTRLVRNKVDFYPTESFDVAYLHVHPTEYAISFNGGWFWISRTDDNPLVAKWMSLHPYSGYY